MAAERKKKKKNKRRNLTKLNYTINF